MITVTYNRIEYLKTFVEMLYLSTDYPLRLIVVDNGSTDGSRELVLQWEKEGLVWKHVFTETNLPLALAFTEGFKYCESEFVCTASDDIIPPLFKHPSWLDVFVAKLQQDESVGCVNFVGVRQSFESFNRKERPKIKERAQ